MSADPKAEKMKEIKTILRSLLVARANTTTTIEQLNGLYRDEEETNIPFHEFGYKRLDDFLMNMPDTLRVFVDHNNRVCVRFVASEASAHVASLVSRQRKPPTRRAPSLGYRSSGYRHFSQRTHNFPRPPATAPRNFNNAPPNLSNRLPDLSVLSNILVRGREYLRSIRSNRGIRKTELMGEMNKVLKGQPYTIPNLNVQLEALASKHNIKVENDLVYFKDMIAPPASTSNINESRASSSIEHKATERHETSQPSQSINQNNGEYKPGENYRQDQSVKSQPLTNGYHSLEPDRNVCLDTNSNYKEHENYEQHNGRTSSTEEFQLYVASSMLTDRTRIRLQKLLQDHPEGIWCTELPSLYKNEYLVSLEYADLGFSNITEFVNAFPDVFSVSDPMQNNRLMVTDATMPNRNQQSSHPKKTMAAAYNIEEYVQPEPDPVPVRLSTNVTQSLIPDGVMSINEILEQIEVGSLIYEEYLEVHVSEIFTPSFFWIQLRKNKKKLTALMTHLQEYYTDPDLRLHSYKIPQVVLEPGLNVACKYGKDWHRGMIKKVRPDGFAIVWFYDYGTVKSYNPNDLYFLHKRFSSLPAQAIACSLFNVKPIGSTEWAFTSTDPFVNKIWEIPMAALIADIDEERNSMTVSLVDVSDDQEDLHINDWLVENGYAEYGKMVCTISNFIPPHCRVSSQQNSATAQNTNVQKKVMGPAFAGIAPNLSENLISYDKKLAAISKYKACSSASDATSCSEEIVYVLEDRYKHRDPCTNEMMKNKFRNLTVRASSNPSDESEASQSDGKSNSQEPCCQGVDKSVNDIVLKMTSTDSDLDSLAKKNKTDEIAITDRESSAYDDFQSAKGRMQPINWTLAIRGRKSSSKLTTDRFRLLTRKN